MIPEVQMILGCFALSLVVTGYIHSYYRVWFLQQDLIRIRTRLREAMEASGKTADPRYRVTRKLLDQMIRNAPLMSYSALTQLLTSPGEDVESSPVRAANGITHEMDVARQEAEGPVPEEITTAAAKAFLRVAFHFAVDSPIFCFILVRALIFAGSEKILSSRLSSRIIKKLPGVEDFHLLRTFLSI